ncbi:MAG: hypothetical protein WCW02_01215 [Candidatus Buchananbacteria bacterium]
MPQRCQELTEKLTQLKTLAKNLESELVLVKQTRGLTNCRQLKQEVSVRLEELDKKCGWTQEMLEAWAKQGPGLNYTSHILYIDDATGEIMADQGLYFSGYNKLEVLPHRLHVKGDLSFFDCPNLQVLPDCLQVEGKLNISSCPKLQVLPDNLQVGGDIVIGGNALLLAQAKKLKQAGQIKGNIINAGIFNKI